MGGIKSEMRNNAPPTGLTQATQDNDGELQSIGVYCAGSRVNVRCRYAEAFINATTAPAPDPLQWEGPFIRIQPRYGDSLGNPNDDRMLHGKRSRGTIADRSTQFASSGGPVSPLGDQGIYYDIDAFGQSGLYLPFDASIGILSVRAGVYIWDAWEIPAGKIAPPTYRQEFTQSRWARNGQVRRVTVPFGAQELAIIGAPDNTSVVAEQEDTGKTVVLGSTLIPLGMFGAGSTAGMRIPCGAFRTIALTAPVGGVVGVVFYITI